MKKEHQEFAKELGKKIKKRREKKNWPQRELAERVGKTKTYIGLIERGKKLPSTKTIYDIAEAFKVKVATLLRD